MKRLFDITVSVVGLLALAPLLILIAMWVRLSLGRPVLFRQTRPGLGGRPFMLVKFRTMREDHGPDGSRLDDAQRLTQVGRFLRATSLDELPELWNVLTGDMSLVGPRPLLMEYLPLYNTKQARRHEVRPGITGWAQIHGRNGLEWNQKFDLDLWYVEHRSFRLDLEILLRTIVQVLRREGISQEGHATSRPFTGNGPDAVELR